MRFRFIQVLTLLCVLAGAFAGVARALDFDDEDPEPVQTEVGRVLDYVIGTHAGCLPHRLEIQSGALPPGTTLVKTHSANDDVLRDHSTFEVTGIPTQAGTFSVWLALRDCDNRSAETLFTFDVGQRTYSITTSSLPSAVAGTSYTAKLTAGGHPIRSEQWTLVSGALPAGLTLSPDGTISGTATAPGSSTFTVSATSVGDDGAVRVDKKELTLNVSRSGSYTVTASRRVAEAGRRFSSTVALSGGQSAVTWSASGGLPPGLSMNAQGVISGVPARAGTYSASLHFAGANGVGGDVRLSLVVRPRLAIVARSLTAARAHSAYRAAVAIRGGVGPMRWSISGLPRGLRASAGAIVGTPATPGTYRVKVRVRDSFGAVAARVLVLRVR